MLNSENVTLSHYMKWIAATILLIMFLIACSDKTAEMYDLARFEELQNNREHAVQIYKEIVEKYPDSPQAKDAVKRLDSLTAAE
jgi:outer membrane protein assembly factor BamD (BamD/ComL family)